MKTGRGVDYANTISLSLMGLMDSRMDGQGQNLNGHCGEGGGGGEGGA